MIIWLLCIYSPLLSFCLSIPSRVCSPPHHIHERIQLVQGVRKVPFPAESALSFPSGSGWLNKALVHCTKKLLFATIGKTWNLLRKTHNIIRTWIFFWGAPPLPCPTRRSWIRATDIIYQSNLLTHTLSQASSETSRQIEKTLFVKSSHQGNYFPSQRHYLVKLTRSDTILSNWQGTTLSIQVDKSLSCQVVLLFEIFPKRGGRVPRAPCDAPCQTFFGNHGVRG
jgi:hypothetical protein